MALSSLALLIPMAFAQSTQSRIEDKGLIEQILTFPSLTEPTEKDFRRLFKTIREYRELVRKPHLTIVLKDSIATKVDQKTLAWWNDYVDEIIDQMASQNYDLKRALSFVAVPAGEPDTRSGGWLSNAALVTASIVLFPLSILAGINGGPELLEGASNVAKLDYGRDVLAFRDVLREAYAETCAAKFAASAPNP